MDVAERQRRAAEVTRQLQLLGISMIFGVLGAVGVVYFLRRGSPAGQPLAMDLTLPWLLVTVGFAFLIVAPFAARRLFRRGDEEELGGTQQPPERLLERYRTANLVGFALREAGGMLGVLTAFIAADPIPGYALAGASILMMARAWPRRETLEAILEPGR